MKQDWYELIGTRGSLNYSVVFCICLKFSMVKKLKTNIFRVLLHVPSPNLFCSVGSLNSQGCSFYYLFIELIFLSRFCPHHVGKEEGACYPKFITCLEDHPCVHTIAIKHRAKMHWGSNGLHRLQAVWDGGHFSHP